MHYFMYGLQRRDRNQSVNFSTAESVKISVDFALVKLQSELLILHYGDLTQ